jgi:dTDP-4-dehydrorhamnose reductase
VFNDGGPHDECLPGRQPRSVYGQSKMAGELATLEEGGCVVRVAGLYGHHRSHKGPTFPETLLSSHDSIKLPTDQRFSPTYAPHAAARILEVAADPDRSGVYHATNAGVASWAEFAESILALTRHDRHVLPYQAKDPLRPRNSSLVSTRLPALPHWALGLYRWAEVQGYVQYVDPRRDV